MTATSQHQGSTQGKTGTRARFSWAMYDWANSSFSALIATFVFPVYFTRQVAENETVGTSQWGLTIGLAGLVIAIAGPVFGAMADQYGRRKPWLAFFTLLSILTTAGLWWVQPQHDWLLAAMLLAGIATVGAESAQVFYNAMLPGLTSPQYLGRWSGWAWGLGYAGGLGCLIVALVVFVGENALWPLPREDAGHVRATFLLVAAWYAVFALPLFLFTPDEGTPGKSLNRSMLDGLRQLRDTASQLREYGLILRFLIARMFFIDGLVTLFAFGGVYAAGSFGFAESDVLMFGIALNVSAGLGAAAFAWVDDRLGSKETVLIALAGLIALGTSLLIIESRTLFWVLGTLLGIFVGPVQAGSRSYMARVAPEHLRTQMFGLFALAGKATAFLGPLLVGWVTGIFDSQRAGMTVIVILLGLGFFLMLTVPAAKQHPPTSP
ncbi:MFS transporter [Proteobacteria bacterium 005FR1]|nr:MFS transporter [Proteobacteria bacterium 005FR1]